MFRQIFLLGLRKFLISSIENIKQKNLFNYFKSIHHSKKTLVWSAADFRFAHIMAQTDGWMECCSSHGQKHKILNKREGRNWEIIKGVNSKTGHVLHSNLNDWRYDRLSLSCSKQTPLPLKKKYHIIRKARKNGEIHQTTCRHTEREKRGPLYKW